MSMGITIDQVQVDRVLTVVQQQARRCQLEEVVGFCPDLTEDQVYLAIDCLIRTGQICLTLDINRTFWVRA